MYQETGSLVLINVELPEKSMPRAAPWLEKGGSVTDSG